VGLRHWSRLQLRKRRRGGGVAAESMEAGRTGDGEPTLVVKEVRRRWHDGRLDGGYGGGKPTLVVKEERRWWRGGGVDGGYGGGAGRTVGGTRRRNKRSGKERVRCARGKLCGKNGDDAPERNKRNHKLE
jgi:hypothetical protein